MPNITKIDYHFSPGGSFDQGGLELKAFIQAALTTKYPTAQVSVSADTDGSPFCGSTSVWVDGVLAGESLAETVDYAVDAAWDEFEYKQREAIRSSSTQTAR